MQETKEAVKQLTVLSSLTQAYTQIASARMVRVRDKVVEARIFLAKINDVFQKVRVSYIRQVRELARSRKISNQEKITFITHNGLKVAVLISSRTGLYGEIIPKTFNKFLNAVRNENMEVVIIGQLGLNLFRQAEPHRLYTYFDFPDYGFNDSDFARIVEHIVQYEEINVFFGKYESVLHQVPDREVISAEISLNEDIQKTKVAEYIFEPSIEKILVFFESEIFASVFEQTIRESQLAKLASRMISMDNATNNIKRELKAREIEILRYRHMLDNKKQLNSLSATMDIV